MSQKLSTRNKAMHRKHDELQKTKNGCSFALATPTHNVVVLETNKKKRKMQPPPRLHGMDPNMIPFLKGLIDTYTDEQFKAAIKKLPEAWQDLNEKGIIVTKRQLLIAAWGEYKDDHGTLQFQEAILSTRAHPHTVTQYDTLLAQSVVTHNDGWTRRITNPLTNERLQHLLQNNVITMQIYDSQHYTTLIPDNERYYHYDGLKMTVPVHVTHLHNRIRQWYGTSAMPPVLQTHTLEVHLPYTPRQTNGWACAMHMLLTSQSAIYQGQVPTLHIVNGSRTNYHVCT